MVDRNNTNDVDQLDKILTKILDYPNDALMRDHVKAMRLGNYDVENLTDQNSQQEKKENCDCCGFTIQNDEIKLCTNMDSIRNIGTSTFLYIQTFKYLSIMLVVLMLIYGLYNIGTNIKAA